MPRYKNAGRVKTSPVLPSLSTQQKSNSTETKYFGLRRDAALSDLVSREDALDEVLTDIQDPAEAATLGEFVASDLEIIDGAVRFDLKKEDFEVLLGASISAEDAETGRQIPLINPRQRISDRITQFEKFAGRGTAFQGQGAALFKYVVPLTADVGVEPYSHTNPPPFFTEALTSTVENAPDYIPVTPEQIERTHRYGFILDGSFAPEQTPEWWWSGEYNQDFTTVLSEYGPPGTTYLTDPKYPIVKDSNISFSNARLQGLEQDYNWGVRLDLWWKRNDFDAADKFMRFVTQVNGHLRIDYYDKTGYSVGGAIQGQWRKVLDTTDSASYYVQDAKENRTSTLLGVRRYFLQGGPSTALGAGTGTPSTARTAALGGAFDLSATYTGREGNAVKKFDDDYVPMVIRFWYGQPSKNIAITDPLLRQPLGGPSFFVQMISSRTTSNLSRWNDYNAQLRLEYVAAQSKWIVDTTTGGSEAGEANFANFESVAEIVAHSALNPPAKPASVSSYLYPQNLITISKDDSDTLGVRYASFSIPGITPVNGSKIWVVVKNRPFNLVPDTTGAESDRTALFQKYVFHPSVTGEYETSQDLLEGLGVNYREPDPAKTNFESNPTYYQARYGKQPVVNTYGADRYNGMLVNSITEVVGERDYDYFHPKLLLVGRQKKGTIAEIGSTPPRVGKNLAAGESERVAGQNYTFIEVLQNEAGLGGNVIINAYPSNNTEVLSTLNSSGQIGKFLDMRDNAKTFTNSSRQNITTVTEDLLPSGTIATTGPAILYEEAGGNGRLVYGSWNGSTFTRDNTGIIASAALGAPGGVRSVNIKSIFIPYFRTLAGAKYSFYGLIGGVRPIAENVSVTVNVGGTTVTSSALFPNEGETTNNSKYIGTEIAFPAPISASRRVTAYNASTQTVTLNTSVTAATYTGCNVWYNHFNLGGVLPGNIVNSTTLARVTRTSVIPAPTGGNTSSRLIQIAIVYNGAYQYTRADNGAGLSFGETLYVKTNPTNPSPSAPFISDAELPAPPADIVTPFGYDNSPVAADPGFGGLCYPPYSIQNVLLQPIAVNDATLYASSAGNFDVWWGGRNVSEADLGQRSLTVDNKLLFDFNPAQRNNLLQALGTGQKPTFTGSEYSHKIEVELGVGLPTTPVANSNLYNDARFYSNNKSVKDKYYLFANLTATRDLELITANNPNWT